MGHRMLKLGEFHSIPDIWREIKRRKRENLVSRKSRAGLEFKLG